MSKIINISLPEELVEKIDKLAKGEYASRSDFIRETLVRRIKGQRIVDEWGDNGELSLRFAGENVVRLAPAILLTRGIMSLMVEGYKVDINALQNGLQVTIPELQIVLQNSFRAA